MSNTNNHTVAISVVVPVYNSARVLPALCERTIAAMQQLTPDFELLLLNDCSPDDSWQVMCQLQQTYPQVRIIQMQQNYGQYTTTLAGIEQARGETIVTMDDDLQFDPADLPQFIAAAKQTGKPMVFGNRQLRAKHSTYKVLPTLAHWLFNYVVMPAYRHNVYFSSIRCFSRQWAAGSDSKYFNIYFVWDNPPSDIGNVPVTHQPTGRDASNYNLFRMLLFFRPYIYFGLRRLSGYAAAVIAIIMLAYWVYQGMATGTFAHPLNSALFLVAATFLFFFVIFTLQVETMRKPIYKIAEEY